MEDVVYRSEMCMIGWHGVLGVFPNGSFLVIKKHLHEMVVDILEIYEEYYEIKTMFSTRPCGTVPSSLTQLMDVYQDLFSEHLQPTRDPRVLLLIYKVP